MNYKSISRVGVWNLLFFSTFALSACPSLNGMPTYPVVVLGLSTTCGKGASVKIAYDKHPHQTEPRMFVLEYVGVPDREQVKVISTPEFTNGPFEVRISSYLCRFPSTNERSIIEVTCTGDGLFSTDASCLARVNMQGTRAPTLPPFWDETWKAREEGTWHPTPAEALFDEPDLEAANAKEDLIKEQRDMQRCGALCCDNQPLT